MAGVVQGNIPPFSSDDLEELITSIDQILMGSAQVSLAPLQLGAVAGALNVNLDMELRKRRRPPVVPRARRGYAS